MTAVVPVAAATSHVGEYTTGDVDTQEEHAFWKSHSPWKWKRRPMKPSRSYSNGQDVAPASIYPHAAPGPPGERVIGNNRVWCYGMCLTGPEHHMTVIAFLMIFLPSCLFDSLVIPWYFSSTKLGSAVTVASLSIVLQIVSLSFFFGTACSDPGIVPRAKNPQNAFDVHLDMHRPRGPPKHQDVVLRGNLYRAPRTVHCSVCDNCVEQFDHHCPWVGNCIGRRNYKRFYAFISCTSALVIVVFCAAFAKLAILLSRAMAIVGSFASAFTSIWGDGWDAVVLVLYTFTTVWFVVGLCAYHSYLVSTNQSTYEQIKGYYDKDTNPWDRGVMSNIKSTLCRSTRPRLFDSRNLTWRPEVYEPRYLSTANVSDVAELPSDSQRGVAGVPVTVPSTTSETRRSGGGQLGASVCGVEICSVAEAVETNGAAESPRLIVVQADSHVKDPVP